MPVWYRRQCIMAGSRERASTHFAFQVLRSSWWQWWKVDQWGCPDNIFSCWQSFITRSLAEWVGARRGKGGGWEVRIRVQSFVLFKAHKLDIYCVRNTSYIAILNYYCESCMFPHIACILIWKNWVALIDEMRNHTLPEISCPAKQALSALLNSISNRSNLTIAQNILQIKFVYLRVAKEWLFPCASDIAICRMSDAIWMIVFMQKIIINKRTASTKWTIITHNFVYA